MAAKFEVYNEKVGKFRFRLKTSNSTRTARRDSVCLTASMLIGNVMIDTSIHSAAVIERRRFRNPAGAIRELPTRRAFLGPDQGAAALLHPMVWSLLLTGQGLFASQRAAQRTKRPRSTGAAA
jgi:hypothetical protein